MLIADGSRTRVGFRRRISARAASKPLTIRKYSPRAFPCPNENPPPKTASHSTRSNFRVIFVEVEEALLTQGDDNETKSAEKGPRGAARFGSRQLYSGFNGLSESPRQRGWHRSDEQNDRISERKAYLHDFSGL